MCHLTQLEQRPVDIMILGYTGSWKWNLSTGYHKIKNIYFLYFKYYELTGGKFAVMGPLLTTQGAHENHAMSTVVKTSLPCWI